MSNKYSDDLLSDSKRFLKKEKGKNRFLYGHRKNMKAGPKYPLHLHMGLDFMRISDEKNKNNSFRRISLDSKGAEKQLEEVLKKGKEVTKLDSLGLIIPLRPDLTKSAKDFINGNVKLSANEFLKRGTIIGVTSDISGNKPEFVINYNNVLLRFSFGDAISLFPELAKFWENKDEEIKKFKNKQ